MSWELILTTTSLRSMFSERCMRACTDLTSRLLSASINGSSPVCEGSVKVGAWPHTMADSSWSLLPSPLHLSLCLSPCKGRITVTGLLDREKGDFYTLTVVADDGGPKKDSTVVNSAFQFITCVSSLKSIIPQFHAMTPYSISSWNNNNIYN